MINLNYSRPRKANLDCTATQEAILSLEAENYWIKRWWSGRLHKPESAKRMAHNNHLIRKLKKWLPFAAPELNARGNSIERSHLPSLDAAARYAYSKGCTQPLNYCSSDGHVNAWVDEQKRIIITYCEGDVTTVTCKNASAHWLEQSDFYNSINY